LNLSSFVRITLWGRLVATICATETCQNRTTPTREWYDYDNSSLEHTIESSLFFNSYFTVVRTLQDHSV